MATKFLLFSQEEKERFKDIHGVYPKEHYDGTRKTLSGDTIIALEVGDSFSVNSETLAIEIEKENP